jgi:hypothetical protein
VERRVNIVTRGSGACGVIKAQRETVLRAGGECRRSGILYQGLNPDSDGCDRGIVSPACQRAVRTRGPSSCLTVIVTEEWSLALPKGCT